MRTSLKNLMVIFAASGAFLTTHALAGSGPSEASVEGSALLVGSVMLVPLSLVVAGSQAVGMSFAQVSTALNAETRWTVTGVTVDGDKTQLTLQSQNKDTLLTVAVPTAQAQKTGIRPFQIVNAKRLGQHSFALEYNNMPLGVIADSNAGLTHSKKRD
jgi:hypothetical protein